MVRGLFLFLIIFPGVVSAAVVTVVPTSPLYQGDVFQVRIHNLSPGVTVKSINFDGNMMQTYRVGASLRALRGLPLTAKTGVRPLVVTLSNGEKITQEIIVTQKVKPVYELPDIPATLGGNSAASQTALVSTLASENKKLVDLFSQKKALWTVPFTPPVAKPIVTDIFGYSRQGSAVAITHKGTDYRAPIGTPIYAMNRGVVRLSRLFRNYGNTVVVDHGLGVMTFYMHLSRVRVAEGQLVQRGQLLGLSGDTGYVSAPHLHLTVRVNGASVDPEAFLRLMGE
jgi:murein DD-endopeptidase MepM/ murein hydrolase activator NlpD